MTFYIDAKKESSSSEISYLLKKCIRHHPRQWTDLVFLCIGSDRMTGDCLGPYIGQQLRPYAGQGIFVYGTLTDPVHALNLKETSSYITDRHPSALVIAIDASLGQKKHLGYVTIGNGALYPGAGVRKELPPVGDIHITGIVNIGGMLEQFTLQTTRLSTVISLADTITQGIVSLIPSENSNKNYTNSLICL
ncbi:MAG: spore protease YyaC [Eubacteriales bacterium]|nr:spore protease YyaC [Eubacteriales bacterium]